MHLQLLILGRTDPIAIPYDPAIHGNMPAWEYIRTVLAPSAGFVLKDEGRTMAERVKGNGLMFDYKNRYRLVKEFVDDSRKLFCTLPLGGPGSDSPYRGNACDDVRCSLCEAGGYDMALHCLHRFHGECLLTKSRLRCPICKKKFTESDAHELLLFL